jgi:hypothetical protein
VTTFPAFQGLTPALARALVDMAAREGRNPEAIAAVVSSESGWDPSAGRSLWSPKRTATGLIQWIESTLRWLIGAPPRPESHNGYEWLTRDWLSKLSAVEQLPLVFKYYDATLGKRDARPVDYYLAGWGAGVGKPLDHVLATKGDGSTLYEQNAGLDRDGNGVITVGDLQRRVDGIIAAARNRPPLQLPESGAVPTSPGSGGDAGALVAVLVLLLVAWVVWGGKTRA